jgi:TRAP-type mannitol/chloroaromatic compound transport system permease small subunit
MKFVCFVDSLSEKAGSFAAWLVIPLMVVVVYEVIVRHIFNAPTVWTYDTLWMLYSMNFLLGGAFTLLKKGHIRIDIIHDTFSPRAKLVADAIIFGLVFFVPCAVLTWISGEYAWESWVTKENLSTTSLIFPAGPIKTVMPIGFFLLALQSVAEVIRNIFALRQEVK